MVERGTRYEADVVSTVIGERGIARGGELELAETHTAFGRPIESTQNIEQRRFSGT